MQSKETGPFNIGSKEKVSSTLSGKSLSLRHIDGPLGVRGRNSDNRRIRKALGYAWIQKQLI
jgi:hypothetical protein